MFRNLPTPARSARWASLCLAGVFAGGAWDNASAATHAIPTSTSKVDCQAYGGGIRPGDAITLRGTSRGPIEFSNCFGTASNPITIRNDGTESGPTVISGNSTWLFRLHNAQHVVVTGLEKWSGAPSGSCGVTVPGDGRDWQIGTTQCGIVVQCTSGSIQSAVKFTGSTRNVRLHGLKIDGNAPSCTSGQGIDLNDHGYKRADHPGEWREGFVISQNYIVDTPSQGFYFGANYSTNGNVLGDLPLRNNEISHNYLFNIGGEGMQIKSTIAGNTPVHHNLLVKIGVRFTGDTSGGGGGHGIRIYEGGYADVFNNRVRGTTQQCIAHLAGFNMPSSYLATAPITIRGNDLHDCGGSGINISGGSGNTRSIPTIYNNTISQTGSSGISVGSTAMSSCVVRDNIVAGETISAGVCNTVMRNSTESISFQRFADASRGDFRLTEPSPARNAGLACPTTDLLGMSSTQAGTCDLGAFKFADGDADSKPKPPGSLAVL